MSNVQTIFTNEKIRQQICKQALEPIQPTEADIERVRVIMASAGPWVLKDAVALFLVQRQINVYLKG